MTDMDILIPWRGGSKPRERAFEWAKTRYTELGIPFIVGEDDNNGQPFCFSRGLNRARKQSTATKFMVNGADSVPDPAKYKEVSALLDQHPWVACYAHTAELSQMESNAVIAGSLKDFPYDAFSIPLCMGIIAMRADVFDDIGGYDEGFVGWGMEDLATRTVLKTLYGGIPAPMGTAYKLWHPTGHRTTLNSPNAKRWEQLYKPVQNDVVATRKMLKSRGSYV